MGSTLTLDGRSLTVRIFQIYQTDTNQSKYFCFQQRRMITDVPAVSQTRSIPCEQQLLSSLYWGKSRKPNDRAGGDRWTGDCAIGHGRTGVGTERLVPLLPPPEARYIIYTVRAHTIQTWHPSDNTTITWAPYGTRASAKDLSWVPADLNVSYLIKSIKLKWMMIAFPCIWMWYTNIHQRNAWLHD